MAALLRAAGHEVVPNPQDADVVVLNTCTITHRADADARRAVRRLTRHGASVVLTGCFVDADAQRAAGMEGVASVLGNADKADIAAAVAHAGGAGSPAAPALPNGDASPPPADTSPLVSVTALTRNMPMTGLRAARGTRARALLKIQDGCNYACAFCIVPSVRGGSRSLTLPAVLDQLDALVEAGSPEVVLTGIHLGTWGRDLRPRRRMTELVREALPRLGASRLRLSSIDPHEIDDDLLALLAENPESLCHHLHLPVQSADDATLVRMRRGHNCTEFVTTVRRAADILGRPGIGTDVIVGFPGEDEAAFDRTVETLRDLPLSYLHVFSYSVRRGTAAESMPNHVGPAEIARRSRILRELSAQKAAAFAAAHAGKRLDVVVNAHVNPRAETWPALASNYLEVQLPLADGKRWAGRRIQVTVGACGRAASVCAA